MTTIDNNQQFTPDSPVESLRDRITFTFRGTVVEAFGNTLVMVNKAGWEHTLTLSPYAHVTCDGAKSALGKLRVGERIRVTTMKSDRSVATDVEAFDQQNEFIQCGREE